MKRQIAGMGSRDSYVYYYIKSIQFAFKSRCSNEFILPVLSSSRVCQMCVAQHVKLCGTKPVLIRGTSSRLQLAALNCRHGLCGWSRLRRQLGWWTMSILNVIKAILKWIRAVTGSQWSLAHTSVMCCKRYYVTVHIVHIWKYTDVLES